MHKTISMPAVVIPLEHQSAPKEHYADKAIRQASEEIASGNYVPDPLFEEGRKQMEGMGLALGLGSSGVAVGNKPALEEFQEGRDSLDMVDQLGNHPRVVEALENMRREVTEVKGHELIEKNCALRELIVASEKKYQWDGKGRWIGRENEEMRYGEILTPQQFYDRLGAVTGKGRIKLSEHVMFPHQGARSGLGGIYQRNPKWDGAAERYRESQRAQALKMGDQANLLMREARSLEKIGRHEQAQKKIHEISALVAEAKRKFDQAATGSQLAEPEFLRIGTIQWPMNTEWMICDFTEWGSVWKPRFYGWRTTLLTMVRCGAITETEADKAFPVGNGEASAWYLQQIFDFRLNGGFVN